MNQINSIFIKSQYQKKDNKEAAATQELNYSE